MRFLLLFRDSPDGAARWAALSDAEKAAGVQAVYDWADRYASRVTDRSRLEPGSAAKLVQPDGQGGKTVIDGPYLESAEVVGGFAIVDVEEPDMAVEIAKAWPHGPVELRRMV